MNQFTLSSHTPDPSKHQLLYFIYLMPEPTVLLVPITSRGVCYKQSNKNGRLLDFFFSIYCCIAKKK
jgi:hypothetical protein